MGLLSKIVSLKNKKIKFFFYLKGYFRYLFIPDLYFRVLLSKRLSSIQKYDSAYILSRVNYYNKLNSISQLGLSSIAIKDFKVKDHKSAYFFDAHKYFRYFKRNLRFNFLPGDITYVPEKPSILKSRPIHGNNSNSVLLNLNRIRHFNFIRDTKDFLSKKNQLVWRRHVYEKKPSRIRFLKLYSNHPFCDVGYTNDWKGNLSWAKKRMTINEQLEYKFILCIEGIDVASNLKWVMSSNSLPVMPKPRFETWFMEGTLKPGIHYVPIKDDFSDLEEKLNYYIQNPAEALKIIENGHKFVEQFKNKKREDLISLMVLDKYFKKTNQ